MTEQKVTVTALLGHCSTCNAALPLGPNAPKELLGPIEFIRDDQGRIWMQPHTKDCPRRSAT